MSCDEKGIDHVLRLLRERAIKEEITPEELMRLCNVALISKVLLSLPPAYEPGHYPSSLASLSPVTE